MRRRLRCWRTCWEFFRDSLRRSYFSWLNAIRNFVSFHALQSLAWHVIYFVLLFGAMIVFFVSLIASGGFHSGGHAEPPFAFFGFFGIFWLFAMGGGILNIILGIVYGIKAHNGAWAQFLLLGGWILRKIVYG